MNYFSFHVGDYSAHTAHLDLMEDLAYRRMLDLYYRTERPLPTDWRDIARLIRMKDRGEQIETVLSEFFSLTDDGWVNRRCEDEISRMQDKQAKARTSAAASVKARNANAQRTLNERSTSVELPTPTPTPTPKEENPPTPRKRGERISDSWEPGDEGRTFALTLGISGERFNSEAARFCDYWSSQPGMKGVKTDWPATWRNWCRNAAERAPPGRTDRPPDRKSVQLQTAALMTGTHRNTVEIIDDSETVIARRLG